MTGSTAPGRRRVTIDDVAARAGVSKSAVSHVVNGRTDIGAGTREKVLRAARDLNWQPAAAAKALSHARAATIGFIPHPRSLAHLDEDPFFIGLIVGAQAPLASAGYSLLTRTVTTAKEEREAYRGLIAARRVDGFILMNHRSDDYRYELIAGAGIHAVAIGETAPSCPFPTIRPDPAGLVAAVEHLVELGHTRLAYVAHPGRSVAVQRRRSVVRAVARRRGATVLDIRTADESDAAIAAAMADLAGRPDRPTALVFTSDFPALRAIRSLDALGLRVPQDVSVLGHDDVTAARWAHPALSTVHVDVEQLADAATAHLLAEVAGTDPPVRSIGPSSFVERASTAAPPGP